MDALPAPTHKRLASIDALRGFDMLLIAGADVLFLQLDGKTGWHWVDVVAKQFAHPVWFGFTFYDFVFPLFLFLAGISIPFSMGKALERGTPTFELYRKAFIRMLLLIALGMLEKNAPFPFFDWHQIRLGSILGRIGIAGFVTVLLFINVSARKRLCLVGGILLAYYAGLMWIPVPGYGAGDLSFEGNLVGWFDRSFLPGRLLQGTYDELGILTQLPALCLTVLGACAGEILRNRDLTERVKFTRLVLHGAVCVALGLLWSLTFPLCKHLWTSSFVLLTGGMAFLFMAVFYGVIDILNFRMGSLFFIVIGMNSLTIYLVHRFINLNQTARLLFGGLYMPFAGAGWQGIYETLGGILLSWCLLYFLYRKKIFLSV